MELWSFTPVKDEEDIIESFVRYNMNIFDGMVISDNGSNDKTLDILYKLKEEGYNLDILVDDSQYFDQLIKRNDLLKHTMEKHNPDFAFPLDADEFVSCNSGENPRKIISKFNKDKLYKYKMKNFVITGKEPEEELFIPKKLDMMRINEESVTHGYKCIVSNKLYKKGISLIMGAHSAKYINKDEEIPTIISEKIYLAHYPVRSKYQLINKIITGRLNNSSLHAREEGLGFHQYEILDEIVKLGTISDETLIDISKTYSLLDKSVKLKFKKEPMSISFCKNIDLKYTKPGNDDKLLSNTIKTAMAIINHMREENKKEHLEYNLYKNEFLKVINSKTWRYKEKIVNLFRFKKKKEEGI